MENQEKKNYSNIKKMLKSQVANNLNVLWTWEKDEVENFTMVYKKPPSHLKAYSPQELLIEIEKNG